MTVIWKMFLCLIASCVLAGCDLAGLPNHERSSKEYLLRYGYSQKEVDALLQYKPLGSNTVAQLACVTNASVRIMLAKNPHLTSGERQVLWKDKDVYVRRSLAGNLRLSHEEMSMLTCKQPETVGERLFHTMFPAAPRYRDRLTVLDGLAENPAAPRETLLLVFDRRRELGSDAYSSFAHNPNCPQEIIDIIMGKPNDKKPFSSLERHWVQITRDRKEQYRQLKAQGKPFPQNEGYNWRFADLWWRDEDANKETK